jgi:hypothetical protein
MTHLLNRSRKSGESGTVVDPSPKLKNLGIVA